MYIIVIHCVLEMKIDKKWLLNPADKAKMKLSKTVGHSAATVKKSMCSVDFFCDSIKTVLLVLFYYTFSISLTFYNKKFISVSSWMYVCL